MPKLTEPKHETYEATKVSLNNLAVYSHAMEAFIVFQNGMVTWIPKEMMPSDAIASIRRQLRTNKDNQENALKGKLPTKDELRKQQLKEMGTRTRKYLYECITKEELELFQIDNRIRNDRKQQKKPEKAVQQLPTFNNSIKY